MNIKQTCEARGSMLSQLDDALLQGRTKQKHKKRGQLDIFAEMGEEKEDSLPAPGSYPVPTQSQILAWEKEFLGLYVSGHPLDQFWEYEKCFDTTFEAKSIPVEIKWNLHGIVEGYERRVSKAGHEYSRFMLCDRTGDMEVLLFAKHYDAYDSLIQDGALLCVRGMALKDEPRHQSEFEPEDYRARALRGTDVCLLEDFAGQIEDVLKGEYTS